MDLSSAQRLKLLLTVLLLTSPNTVSLDGGNHGLHCVNDYLSIINCSVQDVASSENTSDIDRPYWLTITDQIDNFKCILSKTNEDYFCSVNTMPGQHPDISFVDTDEYEILLCHAQNNGSESCELLDDYYMPVTNIKPNPPCCLTFHHNSSQRHFAWKSTYEEYSSSTTLADSLMYELQYFKRGDKHNATSRDIRTERTRFSSDDREFAPDTAYAARVRSGPNQIHYRGQWSDWSSEVHWETGPGVRDDQTKAFSLDLGMVLVPFCVVVPVALVLCFAPLKKWKRRAFIPTPAPYFQTLYSDCHGDFKSWVVTQENATDTAKTEETLQIDTLTKCAEEEELRPAAPFHHQLSESGTYSNVTEAAVRDASLPGVPYAVSSMGPPSAAGSSLTCTSLGSRSWSSAEGDSGCWLCSDQSLDKSPAWYCNEYCTLSTFQQSGPVTAEQHRGSPSVKSFPRVIIGVDAVEEAGVRV